MPIYEYSCEKCGHQLEALQKMSDAPLQECPECHQASLTKLVSAVAFRLKGAGWYETDFKAGDKKNLVDEGKGKGDGDGDKSKDAKDDSSKETKTDDKKSTKDTTTDKKTTETKSTNKVSSTETKSSST